MRKFLIFVSFLLGDFAILVIALITLAFYTSRQSSASQTSPETVSAFAEAYSSYNSLPGISPSPDSQIIAGDARAALVDNFFARYRSPMTGLGPDIISAADRNQIPFGLVPAIAQCEGNLGKIMPENSFNPYGYGIYGDKVTRFTSWQDGIEAISRTLRTDYFDLGLDTPDKIMTKYTPSSNGSWSFCVQKFMEELR